SALQGRSEVDIVRLKNNGLSIAAASPIILKGELVGAVLIGESLKRHAFVDEVKRVTGLEMTVFDRDVRISTTIIRQGKRAVGTLLDNPMVSEQVLQSGNIYNDNADILGRAYKTVYWPIIDDSGAILGMWFIGTEVEGIERTIVAIALSCLLATLVIALALSILGVMLFHSQINPLRKKAYVDKLTGVTNRAGFERAIERMFDEGRGSGGFFLIDLDHFKTLNDTLGHPVGDECLKLTGKVLQEIFRGTDIIARLGGDEFVVYAPTLDNNGVIKEKLGYLLRGLRHEFSQGAKKITVTGSVGVAVCHDGHTSYKEMYDVADSALYKTKNAGRNGYTIISCGYGSPETVIFNDSSKN
ncbi:MAG: diguanylate cyclase, partial [Desulfovibrionaceae bacterium]|nr:diguanylate cyclase [Desulfovibrionaceae bacterium]